MFFIETFPNWAFGRNYQFFILKNCSILSILNKPKCDQVSFHWPYKFTVMYCTDYCTVLTAVFYLQLYCIYNCSVYFLFSVLCFSLYYFFLPTSLNILPSSFPASHILFPASKTDFEFELDWAWDHHEHNDNHLNIVHIKISSTKK